MGFSRQSARRAAHRIIAVASILAVGLVVPSSAAVAQEAPAPVPFSDADFRADATGTVIHADALEQGTTRVEDTEVAFSGAAVDSAGLAERQLNEVDREFQPALADKNTYGRGSGLEVGLGVTPDDDNQVIVAGKAEADAAPDSSDVQEGGPVDADPLAWASTVRGEADANWPSADEFPTCPLGSDLAHGLGFAADAQLVDGGDDTEGEGLDAPLVATDAEDPDRAVSQSRSRNLFIPQVAQDGTPVGDNFGVLAETRQTIAPVTLFEAAGSPVTIEFLGEWVLQAVATGIPGQAYVHYGPGEVDPQTDILRIIQDDEVTNVLTFQDLLGEEGLVVPIEELGIEIAIGENPRAIGGDAESSPVEAADGTEASAAVDVARVRLLDGAPLGEDVSIADLRIGHMEVSAQVPAGGISCPLPVNKTNSPQDVQEGDEFTTTITVDNPFDCDLTAVQLVDNVWNTEGASFSVNGATPPADNLPAPEETFSGGTEEDPALVLNWSQIGPIPAGESAQVTVDFTAQSPGTIHDLATATGSGFENCQGEGAGQASVAGVAVGLEDVSLVGSARDQVPAGAVLGDVLPRTGPAAAATILGGAALLGLGGLGAYLRRRLK